MGGFAIIVIIISIVIFLLLREFWCWFFKINEKISLLEEQNSILRFAFKIQDTDPNRLDYVNTKNLQALHVNKLKEKFELSTDDEERRSIAYELVELGEVNYKKYIR
jgi:hypothetical protein